MPDRTERARARLREIAAARKDEAAAALDALAAGVRQAHVASDLGRTREWVRRLAVAEREHIAQAQLDRSNESVA